MQALSGSRVHPARGLLRAVASMSQALSIKDLFTIGVGPSSSHPVGPMGVARDYAERVLIRRDVGQVKCELFGSLALTGHGHATDTATLPGLSGHTFAGFVPIKSLQSSRISALPTV